MATHRVNPLRSIAYAGRTVLGVVVTLAGIALLALPGPGTLVILIGLALLARDHEWAAHLLHRARRIGARAGQSIARRHDRTKGPQS
jgi:uncharacterized protein (TIGR02611 family)